MSKPTEDAVQRWTAKPRAALVISILKSETSLAEAARKHGLTVAQSRGLAAVLLSRWDNALRNRHKKKVPMKRKFGNTAS